MRRIVVGVMVSVCAWAGAASAGGEVKAAKALVAQQAKLLVAEGLGSDVEGLRGTFTADAVVFLPGAVAAGDDLASLFSGAFTDAHIAIDEVKVKNLSAAPIGAGAAWVTAELWIHSIGNSEGETIEYQPQTVRLTELVVDDGGTWRAAAAHLSHAVTDQAARDDVRSEYYRAPAAVPGAEADAELEALLTAPGTLAKLIGKDKATVVIGSAPKQTALGAAKAKKLLKKWAKLKMVVTGGVRQASGAGWQYAAANVDVTLGKDVVRYRVLAIFRVTGGARELVSLHFSS